MNTYKYMIKPYKVVVTLYAKDSNSDATIIYAGSQNDVAFVKYFLGNTYGAFGHLFNPIASTALDLESALLNIFGKNYIRRIGAVPSYDPNLPKGFVT